MCVQLSRNHEEQLARRAIAQISKQRTRTRTKKIVKPDMDLTPRPYVRRLLDFNALDGVGHGEVSRAPMRVDASESAEKRFAAGSIKVPPVAPLKQVSSTPRRHSGVFASPKAVVAPTVPGAVLPPAAPSAPRAPVAPTPPAAPAAPATLVAVSANKGITAGPSFAIPPPPPIPDIDMPPPPPDPEPLVAQAVPVVHEPEPEPEEPKVFSMSELRAKLSRTLIGPGAHVPAPAKGLRLEAAMPCVQ